jgi:uncharacterized protein YrrD
MQFVQGAGVYTADDQQVGQVDRVVIDPKTLEVTHIVVQKGFLFTEDKVVPLDLIAEANEDRVKLREHAGLMQDLPDFEEQHFINVGEDQAAQTPAPVFYAPPVYWYPAFGAPAVGYGYPYGVSAIETEQNIPEDTVALKDGSEVISADGERVGKTERVLVDPQSNRATHFVISKGLLFKENKLIPMSWVRNVQEDQVHLAVGSRLLDELPDYKDQT